MTGMGSHSRLGRGDRWWLGAAVAFAIAGMLTGFWFSFWNLRDAAQAHGWTTPYMLPLMIDIGIPTYVIIDHLIVRLGWKSRLPRLAAWGFAALTIALNGAAVAHASVLWRIVAAAMPAAWVLGIEVLRLIWRALRKDPASRPDRIPAGRWLASPGPTLLLWRRMNLLGVTSWPLMCALEDARMFLRDLVSAVAERYPAQNVPAAVRQAVRSGRFPGEIHERIRTSLDYGGAASWEPVMETWLSARLRLPEAISDAISAQPPAAPPEAPPQPSPEVSPETPATTPPKASPARPARTPQSAVQRARRLGRKATDGDLLDAIAEMAGGGDLPSQTSVVKALPVGDDRAKRLLADAGRPKALSAVR